MITLGVDPGVQTAGYGVVAGDSSKMTCVCYGAVKTSAKAPIAFRLREVYEGIMAVIAKTKPDCLALEEAFFAKNAQSALKLGMARGVIMLAAQKSGVEVAEYSATLVKQTVSGNGRAEKEQVRSMVQLQLGLLQAPEPIDASDALAVAMTHVVHSSSQSALARAQR